MKPAVEQDNLVEEVMMLNNSPRCSAAMLAPILVVWPLTSAVAAAQTSSGTISGRVLDHTGAVIAGANVTLVAEAIGETRRNFTTDHLGEFVFASIQPGMYDLLVRAQGFKNLQKTGLSLSPSERLSTDDLKLEVGAVNESVEVKAETAQVQTVSSERSALLDSKQVENLMSRGRDVMQLLIVLPGVVNDSEGGDRLQSFGAPAAGATLGFAARHAGALEVARAILHMQAKLLLQFIFHASALSQGPGERTERTAKFHTSPGWVARAAAKAATKRFQSLVSRRKCLRPAEVSS